MAELYWERFRTCGESWDDNSEWVEDITPEIRVFHYFYFSGNNLLKIPSCSQSFSDLENMKHIIIFQKCLHITKVSKNLVTLYSFQTKYWDTE